MSAAKRIFITGGASGLGQALAHRYARAGWRICIGDIHAERGQQTLAALRESGATAHFIRCDVTREEDLKNVATWLQENWSGVDTVVNNAGGNGWRFCKNSPRRLGVGSQYQSARCGPWL